MYNGPTVSVISSDITSSSFTAQLRLSNATSWSGSGSLNVDSSDASILWAYGTSAPSNPSSPSSNFQQHRSEGTFSVNMKAAQVQDTSSSSSDSGSSAVATGSATDAVTSATDTGSSTPAQTSVSAPKITGITLPADIETGLTSYQKVSHSLT